MQFELRTVDPPGVELAALLWPCLVLVAIGGLTWTVMTVLRQKYEAADTRVWVRSFAAGLAVSGAILFGSIGGPAAVGDVVVLLLWCAVGIGGAGAFIACTRDQERRQLGRRTLQGAAIFVLGVATPPWIAAAWNATGW